MESLPYQAEAQRCEPSAAFFFLTSTRPLVLLIQLHLHFDS